MKKITILQKSPETIRKGVKYGGLLTLLFAALLATVGTDTGVSPLILGAAVPSIITTTTTEAAAPGLLQPEVSQKITEMFPSKVPLGHILRKLGTVPHFGDHGTGAYRHEYYSADYRPVQTTVSAAYAVPSGGATLTAELSVANINMFTKDDTILPKFASPTSAQLGYDYSTGVAVPKGSLQLIVVGIDRGQGKITVQTTNGLRAAAGNPSTATMPAIPKDTPLIRLGTALGEIDAQASPWGDLPGKDFNYLQTFGSQFEVTPEQLAHFKEVGWDLSKIKSRTIREMTESQERSILFGQRTFFKDAIDQDEKYTMGGILHNMQNVFTYTASSGFTKENYTAMMKQLFAKNSGDSTRYMFMGSGFAEKLLLLEETLKRSEKPTPEVFFGVKFRGFANNFGQVDTMLHPALDLAGMPDDAIILDFSNIGLVTWGPMEVRELDMIGTGQRNVIAHFMKEKLSLEFCYPETHMHVKAV
jgi:hypothetical protein